jgi:hypothetical protein
MIKHSYIIAISLALMLSGFQAGHENVAYISENMMMKDSAFSVKWNKTVADFGRVPTKQRITANFIVSNAGDKPFRIHQVNYSSSLIAYYKTDSLFPGQSSEIKVMHVPNVAGSFNKQVSVTINGEFYHLSLKGTSFAPPFWQKTEHDFGVAKKGEKLETVFKLYNGSDTLQIENVQASCGCIAPGWPRTPIMPGDSASIKVVFDTRGKLGKDKKTITVYTNRGFYELIIRAEIVKD